MQYHDYLRTVATRFSSPLGEIAAQYDFDHGNQSEIVPCRALRIMLQRGFGICRVLVGTADSRSAGNNIVIYDREGSVVPATVSPRYQGMTPARIRKRPGLEPAQKLQTVLCGNRIEMIPEKPVE